MNQTALLRIIATLFLLMICGYICRRRGILDDIACKRLSTLIIQVGQPMMIISALAEAEFSLENLRDGGLIALAGLALHVLMAGLAFLLCTGFRNPDERKITEFALVFNNTGFIGFPIMQALFGARGLFLASFYVISFHLFIWTWGIAIIGRGRPDITLTVKRALINFGSVPCLIGIAIYLLGIPFPGFALPSFLAQFFGYLGGLCTPISVLITGSLLATRTPRQLFGSAKIYYFSASKLLLIPASICILCRLLGLPQDMILFLTAEAALPSASTITMFSEIYGLDGGYASVTVGMSSLLSVLTMPLILRAADWFLSL